MTYSSEPQFFFYTDSMATTGVNLVWSTFCPCRSRWQRFLHALTTPLRIRLAVRP